MGIKSVNEAGDLKGKKVLVRVDWNVEVLEGQIVDNYRIRKSLPTVEHLQGAGAEIFIASHFNPATDTKPIYTYAEKAGLTLLSDLRGNPGEEANSAQYAEELASMADIFVNEAFSVSHREHASIVGVPKLLPSYAGLRFLEEVEELSKAFDPPHPFLLILGGAKFETKMPMVRKFLDIADEIVIAGANAKPAYDTDLRNNPKVTFPHGDIAALDADQATLESLKLKVKSSKLVLWNGPLGKYKDKKYQWGTKELAKILATCGERSRTIVGGGDTLAAIHELDIHDKFAFISTGGGAMLDFLANETLPGIEALKMDQE